MPVGSKGQWNPAALRAKFLLADIVAPAAAGFADRAAHHQHIDDAAIRHVHVIPVVQTGTDDYHTAAFGVMGVLGEFAGYLNDQFRFDAGMFFLPCRSIGFVIKIIFGGVFAA